MRTFTAIAMATLLCAPALAQETAPAPEGNVRRSELWLATGFATSHFQGEKNLNGQNPGVGVEYRFSDAAAVTAGRFYNSDRDHSKYVGLYYQPWEYRDVRFGAVIGAFDGYPNMRDGGWFPALIPAATWDYKRVGVNLAAIPTYRNRLHGGISLQLKFKLF